MHRLANALVKRRHALRCFSFSPQPSDALYKHTRLDYAWCGKLFRKLEPGFQFRKIPFTAFDIVHFHGDDYLARGSKRRIRTFYGSAGSEALHAQKIARCLYQVLFYLFEWRSCFIRGKKIGISLATRNMLPLISEIIPCGVPLDLYVPGSCKTPHPSILFLGDLKSRKRGNFLLALFRDTIVKKYPACTLTIIGPQHCAGPGIIHKKYIDEQDLIREYQKAWICCMPSSYEGFGVPAIEAMACGTVVAATENAASREIIRHEYNGIRANDTTLFHHIDHVFSDMPFRKNMEKNGRIIVEQKYDIMQSAQKYERVYKALLP